MERRRLKGELHAVVSPELERMGFLAAFTERVGGVSEGRFESLNLSADTGDDPQAVDENRDRLRAALGIDDLAFVRQVHGTRLASVEAGGDPLGEADGMTTGVGGLPLCVLVADCVPLALASTEDGTLSAVHVGWRGLAGGIVQRALREFPEPSRVAAAVGPSIGPCHYEVGPEVVAQVDSGTDGLAVAVEASPRPRLDLGGTVERVLRRWGVPLVDRAGECTACESGRFFSHRRDGQTGRQALVAMRL